MSSDGVVTERRLSNPFPGLRPFEMHESHLFFGRDGQSDQIIRRLALTHFVGVVGTSGSGKSSLIRAGLLPALHGGFMTGAGSSWRIAIMRPGNNPIRNLAATLIRPDVFGSREQDEQIATAILEATLRRSGLGLIEATRLADMASDEKLLVVVDQFEELFRFKEASKDSATQDEAAAFVKLLLEAARKREVPERDKTTVDAGKVNDSEAVKEKEGPIYVVLTMRSDYLGDCAQFRDLPEALNDGQYLIPRMTRDQRREAIEGPVAVGGGEIAPRLVQHLLNDVGDDPDQLPILQHALMRTWQHWEKNRQDGAPIDLADYEAVGTLQDALNQHAEIAYVSLTEPQQKIAEQLFKCLTEIDPGNRKIRRSGTLRQICDVVQAKSHEVVQVINHFRTGEHSYLTPARDEQEALKDDTLIDISHESLIRQWKTLRDWVDQEAESRKQYKSIVDAALALRDSKGGLWRDPELQLALQWLASAEPTKAWAEHVDDHDANFDLAIGFLHSSRKAKNRRYWLLSCGCLVLILLFSGMWVLMYVIGLLAFR